MKNIVQKQHKVLREKAKIVPIKDIASPFIQKVISEMKESLASQEDGVAIAAPQIGYSLRIFVVSKKVNEIIKKKVLDPNKLEDSVYINPVIKKISKDKEMTEEGCLSIRYLYGEVNRAKKATVEAYDQNGKKFTRGGSGLLAQIFQHETDHLNGVLFTDKARNLKEIPPPNIKKVK